MQVELLPSTVGVPEPRQFGISALVNETIAIDAGTLGFLWPLDRQRRVTDIFLTHTHMDHLASLPLFLDNVYRPGPEAPSLYVCPATETCLRQDLFNDSVWPDLFRLSEEESPFLSVNSLEPEVRIKVGQVSVTPIPVDHVVPTMGFLVEDEDTAVGFVSDTGPTERIWEVLRETPNLSAVFVEASFPNSYRWLADKAAHQCPELLAVELGKLGKEVRTLAYHLKPQFFDEIVAELTAMNIPHLEVAVPGRVYEL